MTGGSMDVVYSWGVLHHTGECGEEKRSIWLQFPPRKNSWGNLSWITDGGEAVLAKLKGSYNALAGRAEDNGDRRYLAGQD